MIRFIISFKDINQNVEWNAKFTIDPIIADQISASFKI